MKRKIVIDGHVIRLTLRRRKPDDPASTYRIDYTLPNGTRRRPDTGTSDEAKALAALGHYITNLLPGDVRDCTAPAPVAKEVLDPHIRDVADYYTETYLIAKGAAPKTLVKFRGILNEFERFCSAHRIGRMSQISRKVVDGWAAAMMPKASPSTVENKLACLKSCFNVAVEAGIIQASPIQKWLMPTVPEGEITPLTIRELAELLRLVEQHEPEKFNIIRWIAHTGNRPSDAISLKWSQVDIASRTVERTQVKVKRLGRYQIGPEAMASLTSEKERGRPGPNGEVFTNRFGDTFSQNTLLRALNRSTRAGGFHRGVTVKDLRHTFGFIMANHAGCPLPTLQVLMGHSDVTMTMRYVRPGDATDALCRMSAEVSHTTARSGPRRKKVT